MELAHEVVLVTGASRGLGAAIARTVAARGAAVAVNYLRSEQRAAALVAELRSQGARAAAFGADVTDPGAVQGMVAEVAERLGPVSCLVNNALVGYRFSAAERKPAWAMDWADYQAQLDGSLKAAYNTVQAVLPMLRARPGGRIVNIGSDLVHGPLVPYHDYITAKGALLGFTRALAADLGPFGITVNMVSGGLIEGTDASADTTEAVKDAIRSATPVRRLTQPEDVAHAVAFFLSPGARAVTGQELLVDGGLVMR